MQTPYEVPILHLRFSGSREFNTVHIAHASTSILGTGSGGQAGQPSSSCVICEGKMAPQITNTKQETRNKPPETRKSKQQKNNKQANKTKINKQKNKKQEPQQATDKQTTNNQQRTINSEQQTRNTRVSPWFFRLSLCLVDFTAVVFSTCAIGARPHPRGKWSRFGHV